MAFRECLICVIFQLSFSKTMFMASRGFARSLHYLDLAVHHAKKNWQNCLRALKQKSGMLYHLNFVIGRSCSSCIQNCKCCRRSFRPILFQNVSRLLSKIKNYALKHIITMDRTIRSCRITVTWLIK